MAYANRSKSAQQRSGVFISYARSDGEAFAHRLRHQLEKQNIRLWQDRVGMEGGRDWWLQITEALDNVSFMALVVTPKALKSEIIRKEWRYARQQGVCVYPIKGAPNLDFNSMPRWMRDQHFYDLGSLEGKSFGPEWQKFLADLNKTPDIRRVPFMVEDLPAGFVQRPNEFDQLVALREAEAVALLSAGLEESSDGQHVRSSAFRRPGLASESQPPEGGTTNELRDLARRLGEWPLLLKLANGVLRNRVRSGETLPDAIAYANRALDRRGLKAFNEHNPIERNQAVEMTLRVSERSLASPRIVPKFNLPDLPHPALIRTLEGHSSYVTGCAFSPDGKLIVSASSDRTLKVWDSETGRILATFFADGPMFCCVFYGEMIVAGGARGVYFLRLVR